MNILISTFGERGDVQSLACQPDIEELNVRSGPAIDVMCANIAKDVDGLPSLGVLLVGPICWFVTFLGRWSGKMVI